MKIRTALTLKNVCVTASVLVVIFVVISIVIEQSRSRTFYNDLKGEAITKAHLFLQHRVDAPTMQNIYLNNRQFINEVEVAVYTPDFDMLYHDAIHSDIIHETRQMIDRIVKEGVIEMNVGKYQGVGLLYNFEGKDYVVTAAAYDGAGHANRVQLQIALLILFFVGLIPLFAAGYLMARSSLKPIRRIVREAEHISGSDIDRRLPVVNRNDELGELSSTFNDLLERLESAFTAQRQFVSNVSHELRTPLAAIIAQLDLSLQKQRTVQEYRRDISAALSDAYNMRSLIDGLLNLAKTDYQRQTIKMQDIRLDELLLDVRQRILTAHPQYNINLIFDLDDETPDTLSDESAITIQGNVYLLTIAFANLIENNCKYSADHTSLVQISHWQDKAIVRMSDCGRGMSQADLDGLFTLFHRGESATGVDGHGIGMALVQKIVALHQGTIQVHSCPNEGTTFITEFKHI